MSAACYSNLKRQDPDGKWRVFTALRAVGLAVESGHKLACTKGLGAVTTQDISSVRVSGALQQLDGERWRSRGPCDLQLATKDAELAKTLVWKQRGLLADLGVNVWAVDVRMPSKLGSFDLLCDFSRPENFSVPGRLWVELKVMGASRDAADVDDFKKDLSRTFVKLTKLDASIGGVLLLLAKVEEMQGGTWGMPSLSAHLWQPGAQCWRCLVAGGPKRVARGQSKGPKPSLAKVWENMVSPSPVLRV